MIKTDGGNEFLDHIRWYKNIFRLYHRSPTQKIWPFQNWVSAVPQGPRPYILSRQKIGLHANEYVAALIVKNPSVSIHYHEAVDLAWNSWAERHLEG